MAKRVLVVDDELDLRTYIARVLEAEGYQVGVAADGEQGMVKARAMRPHLVVLDVMMPQHSGLKMYRDLRTGPEFRQTPVLVVSGLARKTFLHSQRVLDNFKRQSVPEPDGYIEKPPEPEEILGEVGRLIRGGKAGPAAQAAGGGI